MRARERIIRERFADQKCAHCGSPYPADGVLILARRSQAWMVMASCANCEQRGVFVVSFPTQPPEPLDHLDHIDHSRELAQALSSDTPIAKPPMLPRPKTRTLQ